MRNYISKINDRNLQRKRESGLTSYALYSVLLIIVYKAAQQYPHIPFKTNFREIIYIFTCTVNILVSLTIIYSIYELTLGHLSSIRLILKSNKSEILLENILQLTTIFVLPAALNGLTLYYQFQSQNSFNLFFFLTGLILCLFTILAVSVKREERKINHTYEVFEGTGNVGTDKDFVSILFYTLGILAISHSVYYAFSFQTPINKNQTVIYCALLYSIPLILIKIMDLRKTDGFSTALENLEYEINIRNLSDEEIRERLQKNYMGFLLSEWIEYNLKKLSDFQEETKSKKIEINTMKIALSKIDSKSYPLEFNGRKEEIEKEESKLKNGVEKFFNEKLNEIENVWEESKLEPAERNELSKLYNQFNRAFEKNK